MTNGLDAYDEEEQTTETSNDSESGTYVELINTEHPEGYEALKGGGPIRSFFRGKDASIKDFMADLMVALAPFFDKGDKLPILEFIGPNADDLNDYIEEHDHLEGTVEELDGDE